MPRSRTTYTAEFKLTAVKMITERKLAEAAHQLDNSPLNASIAECRIWANFWRLRLVYVFKVFGLGPRLGGATFDTDGIIISKVVFELSCLLNFNLSGAVSDGHAQSCRVRIMSWQTTIRSVVTTGLSNEFVEVEAEITPQA